MTGGGGEQFVFDEHGPSVDRRPITIFSNSGMLSTQSCSATQYSFMVCEYCDDDEFAIQFL